jgi:hypothetical protein
MYQVCVHNNLQEQNFFPNSQNGHVDNFNVPNCPRLAQHQRSCKRRGLKGTHLRSCVFDLCSGLPKRVEKRIVRQTRRENRVRLQPTPRRVNPRPARRFVPRPMPVRRRAPVVRRRGRGDVWMQTKGGKWIDVNDRGTFKYLEDNKIGLTINVQFTARGKGTVISAIALHAKGKTIVAESDGTVKVDGNTVLGRKGKGAVFEFKGDNINTYKFKRHFFEIRGLRKERLSFEYDRENESYQIVVGSIAQHHIGLYADPEHAEKYQVSEDNSPFEQYVSFRKVRSLKPTRNQLKKATECCKELTGVKRSECVTDFVRTNQCLHYYTEEAPSID